MFDFEGSWDVGQEAESLNKSLFGSAKRKSKHQNQKAPSSKNNPSLFYNSDDDDETFTKKGVRKMKEKRRKQKKRGGDYEMASFEKIPLSKKELHPSQDGAEVHAHEKKRTGKKFKGGDGEAKDVEKKNKRKRASSESRITESPVAPKTKRKKLEEDAAPSVDDSTEKKRKRKRKKKNNSKKNKYAHLALNRQQKENGETTSSTTLSQEKDRTKPTGGVGGKSSAENPKGAVVLEPDIPIASEKSKKIDLLKEDVGKLSKKRKSSTQILACSPSPTDSSSKTKRRKLKSETNVNGANTMKEEAGVSNEVSKATNSSKSQANNGISKKTPTINPKENGSLKAQQKGGKKDKVVENGKSSQDKLNVKKLSSQKAMKQLLKKQEKLNEILSKSAAENELALIEGDAQSQKNKKKKKKNNKSTDTPEMTPTTNKNEHSPPRTTSSNSKKRKDKSGNSSLTESNEKALKAKIKVSSNPTDRQAEKDVTSSSSSVWGDKATSIGGQAREKLNAARFRYLNEQLYTCQGSEALKMFRQDREAFKVYHAGFENQAAKWPINPVNVLIKQLKDKSSDLVLADFGCGDAKLAQTLTRHKVHSFDLVALNPWVTACDMTRVPLPSESVDIAVFCLSLMGTNLDDYIQEANRVLKTGGLLKIVEVVSRFRGLSPFLASVCSHGFQLLNKRDLSQMFYLMDFRKVKTVKKTSQIKSLSLKPCIYKKR